MSCQTRDLTVGFKIALSLMHLIARSFIIYFLRRKSISHKEDASK